MCAGVAKSGSPISRWMIFRPVASSARALASTSNADSVPSRDIRPASRVADELAMSVHLPVRYGSADPKTPHDHRRIVALYVAGLHGVVLGGGLDEALDLGYSVGGLVRGRLRDRIQRVLEFVPPPAKRAVGAEYVAELRADG